MEMTALKIYNATENLVKGIEVYKSFYGTICFDATIDYDPHAGISLEVTKEQARAFANHILMITSEESEHDQ